MEAFVVKILPSLLIIVLVTSSVTTEKLSLGDKNGKNGRTHGNMNKTKDGCNQDRTGTRKKMQNPYTFTADRQCYKQFFVKNEQPEGLRNYNNALRYICQPPELIQDPKNTYYATMFDERYGIAVFSAYKLTEQLVKAGFPGQENAKPNFEPTPGITFQGKDDMYTKQPFKSLSEKRVLYDKGHLVPAKTYSDTLERLFSTYTYTNAVPQHHSFNSGMWKSFELTIRNYASNQCIPDGGTLYLLTGTAFIELAVQPGHLLSPQNPPQVNHPAMEGNRLRKDDPINRGIYIPYSLWTAGCCVHPDNTAASFAVIGNNQIVHNLKQIRLAHLQDILGRDVGPNPGLNIGGPKVNLFPGNPNCVNKDLPNPLPQKANKK